MDLPFLFSNSNSSPFGALSPKAAVVTQGAPGSKSGARASPREWVAGFIYEAGSPVYVAACRVPGFC